MWTYYLASLAAALAALAAITRRLHLWRIARAGAQLAGWIREFLEDWRGSPGRPGEEPIPGFPARMERVEKRAESIEHFTRGDISGRLQLIGTEVHGITQQADRQHELITTLVRSLDDLEKRVTDHRRRNDIQIDLLQQAVDRLDKRFTNLELRIARRRATDYGHAAVEEVSDGPEPP